MKPFVVTERARRDLLAIWQRIAEDRSAETANRVVAAFYDAIQKLAEYPGIGHTPM